MKDIINNQKGLTLIEIMIAIVILGMIFVSFLSFFGGSMADLFYLRNRKEAVALASSKMEKIYALQPVKEEDINDLKQELADSDDVDISFEVKNNSEENGYKVIIKVTYQPGDRTVELTSFVRGEE
ncbi:MAG: type IV pilus modification PilV family protein [Bacillota bacterium]